MTAWIRMTKVIAPWLVVVAFAGAAFAQPAPAPADPANAPAVSDARKACTDAMNADPQLAAAIIKTADEKAAAQRDKDTLAAHLDADRRIQQNERHVIFSYAAMWVIAAGFVIFLWRRQQGLKEEIASLRRELEAAAGDASSAKAGS
jgi:hypothetical protein